MGCQPNIVHIFTVKYYILGFSPEAGEYRLEIAGRHVRRYSALNGIF
jgi:hypothetical protein